MAKVINSRLCYQFKVSRGHYEGLKGFSGKKVDRLPHKFHPILHQTKIKLESGERLRLEYSVLNPHGDETQHIVVGEISNREGEGFINTVFEDLTVYEIGIHCIAILNNGIQIGQTPFEIMIKNKPTQTKK